MHKHAQPRANDCNYSVHKERLCVFVLSCLETELAFLVRLLFCIPLCNICTCVRSGTAWRKQQCGVGVRVILVRVRGCRFF